MRSWVLWPWASVGRNWKTPKTWKTSTSTASSSELARYVPSVLCVCLSWRLQWWVSSMSVHAYVNSWPTFILPSLYVPTCGSPHPLCPDFNLPSSPPLSSLPVENSTYPVTAQQSQTKHRLLWPKRLACSQREHTQPLFHFDGSNTRNVLNDGLVIMEN